MKEPPEVDWLEAANFTGKSTPGGALGYVNRWHRNGPPGYVGSLMDYNARFFSPALGRFISADTIVPGAENSQAFNRYAYVSGRPLNLVDPTGNCGNAPGQTPCPIEEMVKDSLTCRMDQGSTNSSSIGPVSASTVVQGSSSSPDLSDKWMVDSGTYGLTFGPLVSAVGLNAGVAGVRAITPRIVAMLPPTAAAIEKMAERYQTNPGSGVTVLGRFPDKANGVLEGFQQMAARLGANAMNVPAAVWDKLSKADRWNLNRAVLDSVIKRGDKIRLSFDYRETMDFYVKQLTLGKDWLELGGFVRELAYLQGVGYTLVERMINGQMVQFMEKIP